MPFHDNQLHVFGFLAAVQSAYNSPTALVAADHGFLPYIESRDAYATLFMLEPEYDGSNGVNIDSLFPQKRVAPKGFTFKGTIPHRFRGAGAPYESAVVPPWDVMMKGAGFDASTTDFVREYVPIGPGVAPTLLTIGAYMHGGKRLYRGMNVLGKLTIEFASTAPPLCSFELFGVRAAVPTQVSKPDITYAGIDVQPPNAAGAVVSFGDFAQGSLKSGMFDSGRALDLMTDLTLDAGIVGPSSGGWSPILKLRFASTILANTPFHEAAKMNEYELRENAVELPVSVEFGTPSSLGNHMKIASTSAQIIKTNPGNEGSVDTVELELQLNDVTITCESEEASS